MNALSRRSLTTNLTLNAKGTSKNGAFLESDAEHFDNAIAGKRADNRAVRRKSDRLLVELKIGCDPLNPQYGQCRKDQRHRQTDLGVF